MPGAASWFPSLSLKKKMPDAPAPGANGDAADPAEGAPDEAPPAAAKAVAPAPSAGHMDGGADRYRALMRERELKAQMRAAGAAPDGGGSSPSTPSALNKGTKSQAAKAVQVRAKRLMKELRDVKRSAAVKDGVFDVDLHDENLYEWDVWLKKWDPDSKLAGDLRNLGGVHGISDVWIRVSFPENFPFSPPFIRVLAPNIQGGFVLSGGAICMELLTPDGWSSAYTVEAVLHQTMSTMVKGEARVVTRATKPFTEAEARRSYDYLVKTHKKHGWHTPALKEG